MIIHVRRCVVCLSSRVAFIVGCVWSLVLLHDIFYKLNIALETCMLLLRTARGPTAAAAFQVGCLARLMFLVTPGIAFAMRAFAVKLSCFVSIVLQILFEFS